MPRAFVVPPGGGTLLPNPVAGDALIKAGTAQTAGSAAVIEVVMPPGRGPVLHVHAREDEMWWVLEGDFRFRADDELMHGPAGSFVFVPRGVAHCFQNIGDVPGRVLVFFTPAGMERFFEQVAGHLPGPLALETFARIAHDQWMEVVGPPLSETHPL